MAAFNQMERRHDRMKARNEQYQEGLRIADGALEAIALAVNKGRGCRPEEIARAVQNHVTTYAMFKGSVALIVRGEMNAPIKSFDPNTVDVATVLQWVTNLKA